MNKIRAAGKIFNLTTEVLPQDSIKRGVSNLPVVKGKNSSSISIPIHSNDETIKAIIQEYQLQKPENMIRFLVEALYANLESISDSSNDLIELNMKDTVALVDGVRRQYELAMDNEDGRIDNLKEAERELLSNYPKMEEKANFFIEKVRSVDNRSALQFLLKSKLSVNQVITYNKCAKMAVLGEMRAVAIQKMIANVTKTNIEGAVIRPYEEFRDRIIAKDNISLMHAYDKEKQEEFWLKLPDKMKDLDNLSDMVTMYNDKADEDDIDFDNIDFT